jgi:hypothetical protein
MSIIRVKKEREYVSIANAVLQDKALSWEARGVMAYLLSKPDGWECRNYDLVNQGPAGKHIIQRVLKELKEAGYIYRYRKSDGHKIKWVTEIYETPELNTTSRNTDILTTEKPTVGNSDDGESGDIVSTDSHKVLNTESNDSAPQKPKIPDYTQSKKADLNALGHCIADQMPENITTREQLRESTLLCYDIAQLCKLDIAVIILAGQKYVLKSLAMLAIAFYTKGVTANDLDLFRAWWYAEYWLGRDKGQPPTAKTIMETWGQFEAAKVSPAANGTGPVLSEAQKARLAELSAENA